MNEISLPLFCPQTGASRCGLTDQIIRKRLEKQPYALIMIPYGPEGRYDDTIETIRKVVSRKEYRQYILPAYQFADSEHAITTDNLIFQLVLYTL